MSSFGSAAKLVPVILICCPICRSWLPARVATLVIVGGLPTTGIGGSTRYRNEAEPLLLATLITTFLPLAGIVRLVGTTNLSTEPVLSERKLVMATPSTVTALSLGGNAKLAPTIASTC